MKIRKIGHCCLLIETDAGKRILTDPGNFSTGQNEATGIDLAVITHEHADHFHVESLKAVLANNPTAQVVANAAVGTILAAEGIVHQVLEGEAAAEVSGVPLEAHDARHEEIFEEMGQVQNTGFFIAGRLFYPGDAFAVPAKPVEILALPVAGPWCRIRDAVRYALAVKPKVAFPVHDGMIQDGRFGSVHGAPAKFLPPAGIEFRPLGAGEEADF
jgi:L-ascorbate metabolism protein UlaG (beta-lactamase superfamily)